MTIRTGTRLHTAIRRAALGLLAGGVALLTPAVVQAAPSRAHVQITGNDYLVRHGVVPPVGGMPMAGTALLANTANSYDLSYQGGAPGAGVDVGAPKVYLVFYGSQWGTASTSSSSGVTLTTFANDPSGMAPALQNLFIGLGTNQESWSNTMTQYCESTSLVTVPVGAIDCPTGAAHVGYPTGGALAGVWYDNSVAEPTVASQSDLATEAQLAASHFGNTTSAANANVQYMIVSSTGLNPGGFNAPLQWCAWHSDTGGTNGTVAYTNMPYLTDVGYSCGQNFVNANGTLDGVSMVAGHEYGETLTDKYPAGGWYNASYGETGDLCAWNANGGVSANVSLVTGLFAMQPMWSNSANSGAGGCAMSTPTTVTNTVTFSPIAPQSSTINGVITAPAVSATDSDTTQKLTYSVTGLPQGLSINATSGAITGTPTQAIWNAAVTVTATDPSGATGSTSFTWTVTNTSANTITFPAQSAKSSPIGLAISPTSFAASDNQLNQSLSYSATGLPAGLSISSTGKITGTPTTAGTTSVTVTATDLSGAQGAVTFNWTITVPPRMSITPLSAYTFSPSTTIPSIQVVASDGTANALSYAASGLPSGLSISATTGIISGKTGSTKTSYNVNVTVTDSTGGASATASATWKVVANTITVTKPSTQTTLHSTTATPLQIVAKDSQTVGAPTLSYSASGLPTGLSISSSTGVISGKAGTTARSYSVSITVRDQSGASGTTSFTWTIS